MSLIEDNLKCVESLKPKKETGVVNFLTKYPDFDGTGVTIAVLDSGVCCSNADLRIIPNGEVKVIERFDCSGAGDVELKEVKPNAEGLIVGQTGKNLKISNAMKKTNKTNNYYVGLKCIQELFPSRIRERESVDVKTKEFDDLNKKFISEVSKEISDFDSKNSSQQNLNWQEKLTKENLENQLEFLNNCDKKFVDVRTSYDVIVFETEECWTVCIDTTETGDLENAKYIREFSKFHEVIQVVGSLRVSFNFHDKNFIELVGLCSSHGTHVSSIAAGYDPDCEKNCGIAPSAKIVSLTIGDARLGSMETGTSLVRAIIKIMELCESGKKVDIINMSYGEHAHWSNSGRVGELISEVVSKYGVIWVASAGNHGPALSTIGTPPDVINNIVIGVGAYISPDMMQSEYILREKLPANVYTWTSRDPCIDGGQAVTICAPGAAIASVPEHTFCKSMLMNGTSMASPHVAGALALILSGLKQLNIAYTPFSIKRALTNTAQKLSYVDEFAQGAGLLNVEKLFEYLNTYKEQPENNVRFSVTVGNCSKGIHIRQGHLTKPEEFNVTVEPVLFNEKYADCNEKVKFNLRLTLIATESWVQVGQFIDLCYSSRSFNIKIDPSSLSPGVHTAQVQAYDANCIEKGILFHVPITIIQPNLISSPKFEYLSEEITFKPNTIVRNFILVPRNATYAVLEMISTDINDKTGGKFLVHTMQILPNLYCKARETQKILPVNSESFTYHPFKVKENNILEVCIAKYWSNFGDISLKYRVRFQGFQSNNAHIMHHSQGIHRFEIVPLKSEEFQPSVTLKGCVVVLKPVESKISPLTARDIIPNSRQIFNNQLVYNLHMNKGQEVAFHVPLFYENLYESEFESQFFMVFDSNKMMVCCGDAYSQNSFTKLEKGDYTIKLQVRHEKKDLLEKVSEATLLATFKLQNSISLEFYKSYNNAITQNKKITSLQLPANCTKAFYIAPLQTEKITKNAVTGGNWFEGCIVFAKDDFGKRVDMYNFKYVINEGPVPKKLNGNNTAKENKSKMEEYKEALRDFQTSMISKLDLEDAENLYKEIMAENQNFLGAHLSLIGVLEGSTEIRQFLPNLFKSSLKTNNNVADLKKKLEKIADLSNSVISEIDQVALLAFIGIKNDTRPDAAKQKPLMEKQKQQLIEAFVKKAVSLGKLSMLNNENGTINIVEELDNIVTDVMKYIDLNDSKVLLIGVWHAFVKKQYGRMLKYLQKIYDDKLQRDVIEEMKLVVIENNWSHIEKFYINKILVHQHPTNYRPF